MPFPTRPAAIATAMLGLALTAFPAAAEEFRPLNTSVTLTGSLAITTDITNACDVTINLSIDGSGNATMTGGSFAPGFAFCTWPASGPTSTWTLTPGPGTSSVDMDIAFDMWGWSCAGTVDADYDNTAGTLTFDNVGVPGDLGITCRIDGTLTSSPKMTIIP